MHRVPRRWSLVAWGVVALIPFFWPALFSGGREAEAQSPSEPAAPVAAERPSDDEALDLEGDDEPLDPEVKTSAAGTPADDRERRVAVGGENVGWLVVTSEPAGLDVFVGGKVAGRTPLFEYELTPGKYDVRVADRCYEGQKRGVLVKRGASTSVAIKGTAKEARVQVAAEDDRGRSVPAVFFVDGRKVGASPATFKVPLCSATLALQRDGVGRWSGHVELDERRVTPVRGVLRAANLLPALPTPTDYVSIIPGVLGHLERDYVEPARARPDVLLRGALSALGERVSGLKVETQGDGKLDVSFGGRSATLSVAAIIDLTELAEVKESVLQLFLKDPLEPWSRAALETTLLNGALAALGDDSRISVRREGEAPKDAREGRVGLEILSADGTLRVASVIDASPAADAGLRALDVLERIGEEPAGTLSAEQALALLSGPVGSEVALTVLRRGWVGPRRYVLVRRVIEARGVESRRLAGDIGYVRVRAFSPTTNRELGEQLARLGRKKKLRGLVLDLRDNVRGTVEEGLPVADRFLANGDLVTRASRADREVVFARASGDDLTELPLTVLANFNTALAAEVVVGALQGLGRAMVVGEPTRGHASLETTYPLPSGFALRLRTGQYLTAGGRKFEGEGIRPDVFLIPVGADPAALGVLAERAAGTAADGIGREAREKAARDRAVEVIHHPVFPERRDQDYALDLARALISRVGAVTREPMVRNAKGLLARERERQRRLLGAAAPAAP